MKQAVKYMLGFLMLWAAVAQAEVRIEITQGVDSARPIGIVPFQVAGGGAVPEEVGAIIAADLRNSGKFNPIALTVCRSYRVPPLKWFLSPGRR